MRAMWQSTLAPLLLLLFLLLLTSRGGGEEEVTSQEERMTSVERLEDDMEEVDCSSIVGCQECISSPGCVYCRDPENPRCGTSVEFSSANSSCVLLEDPPNILDVESVINQSLTSNYSSQGYIQISPQYVRVKLRVGSTQKIQFRIAQAREYPVDLYYLMDLSNSMSDDRDNIVKLGGELATAIEEITRDYRIGFGSFVDKELMPYISLVQDDNCQQNNCPAPYSFQHQMSLRRNATEFAERVRNAPISGNIDNPEGGLDALMQVMVCGEKVGWRKKARRVIIYTTDQSFHSAGDGKLGGLTQPNDGLCHLNSSGYYDWSTLQDYPSLGHINHVAKNHSVNLVWAVTASHLQLYRRLTHMIPASVAGEISSDSSNVVEMVRRMYQKITSTIKVEDHSSSSLSVHYTTTCNKKTEKRRQRCKHIPLGTPVTFTAHITLKECSQGPHTVSIQPVGLKDRFLIEVEPICECECSRPGGEGYEFTSPECNFHGDSVCGHCHCFDTPDRGGSYFGSSCECSGNHTNPLNPDSTCRPPSSPSTVPVCSGRGSCECGVCHCDQDNSTLVSTPQITGDYCECDNTACDRSPSGALCSGRGSCICGKCRCNQGWTGDACDCLAGVETCIDPDSGRICSGHGECKCGVCQCSDDGYSGPTCSECETCPDKCESLKSCVECLAWPHIQDSQTQCSKECKDRWEYTEEYYELVPDHWVNCTHKNNTYCKYSFSYELETWQRNGPEKVILHLDKEGNKAVCPIYTEPDYFGIIIGIAGGIVCVGMLTILLWKAFTTVTDRREFARFEAERQKMKWNSNANPIFRQATTTVQNPMYCKGDF